MRIVTGTFSHETNTCSNIPTTMEEFAKQGIAHGDDIPRRFRGTNTIEAAFMDAAEEHGFELIWTVFGSAIPGGTVSRPDTRPEVCRALSSRLRSYCCRDRRGRCAWHHEPTPGPLSIQKHPAAGL